VGRCCGREATPAFRGSSTQRLVVRRVALACLVIVAVAAVLTGSTGSAQAAPAGFVTRVGTGLQLDGQAYRFSGINIYNANNASGCWYQLASGPDLGTSLDSIGAGAKVIRAWFFQSLATTAGVRDWSGIDHTLAVAAAHGVKVIATLGNQWIDCDGPAGGAGPYKTDAWYSGGYTQPDPAGTESYREWVAEIVARYKDDPTIMAWQLMNEAEVKPDQAAGCSTDAAAILRAFAVDVSGLIKSIDPDHLVSLGTMGGGQCGAQGAEYQSVHDPPTIDLCEYHDYTPNAPMPGDQWNGLQVRLQQCGLLNKPLIVDETGIHPNDVGGTLVARREAFRAKFTAQFNAGVAGELVWAWNKDGSALNNYDVGPGDPLLGLLAAFRSGVPSIPIYAEPAFCHGAAIGPQSGKFLINDDSCVVNFLIGPQDGSWTSADLESSTDGGVTWHSDGNSFPNVNVGQVGGSALGPCNAFGLGLRLFRAHGTLTTIGGDVYSDVFPVAVDVQSCPDTTPPFLLSGPIVSPNPSSNGAATITWTAGDNKGVTGGEYFVGADPGTGNGIQVSSTYQFTASVSNLAPGTYVIGVRAHDAAGNWSSTATASLTVMAGGSTTQTASGGQTVTTDPTNAGATPDVPVQTQVTLPPSSGTMTISITAQLTTGTPASGFGFFGTQVVIDNGGITVPAESPYVVRFTVDASSLDGVAPADVQVFRDGAALADCTDSTAAIPGGVCVASRVPGTDGDAVITVRTIHFSTWNVGRLAYSPGGFLQPVDNMPVVNSAKAGSAIPVKFKLGGNRGLNIFQSGYPAQKPYACGSASIDAIEQTVTASVSGLTYDAASDMYTYVWRTDKAWTSTCRELTLRFRDGSTRVARFTFTK
jgi:mannan endo-1,4-beta-mannosidase